MKNIFEKLSYYAKFLRKIPGVWILFLCSFILLGLSLRGNYGNPTASQLGSASWQANGPFELSPERGRFALTYSLVEDHSFQFSNAIGKFASPDVGISRGHYVSLFAPFLSFVTIPGYIIGKYFGISQVGAFAVIALFAFLNMLLIRAIAIRLGADKIAATIASIIFLFATPAFAYAVDLYQHHVSTFLLLLAIYLLLKSKRVWALTAVFFLCGASVPLDYPNLFFMFPIGVYALGQIISYKQIRKRVSLKIDIKKILTPLIVIIPMLVFLWLNQVSYGNAFQLSGTLPSAKAVHSNTADLASVATAKTLKQETENETAIAFFQTRNLVNGLYIHFISPDRGMLYYTPVILFGFIGFFVALRKKGKMVSLLAAIIGANILLYSMWGDPGGGWAFGSRYLIPSYAILAIFIAILLTHWRKKLLFVIPFAAAAVYSIAVNTLGAITTSALPPKVEVLSLEKISGTVQKYTYMRNWDFLVSGNSKSFVYQVFLRQYLSTVQFYILLAGVICVAVAGLIAYLYISAGKEKVHV